MIVDVVIPIFNEQECLEEMYRRLHKVRESSIEVFELRAIFVNDGSTDDSAVILKRIARQHDWISAITLARNFGHQAAVTAGLAQSQAEYCVIIDGDLQDPPELIPELVKAISNDDVHIVYGRRIARKGETLFKKKSASFFYKFIRRVSSVDIPLDTGDFRIMDRQSVQTLLKMPERNRFLRGMIPWTGLSAIPFDYEREMRHAGETKYTLRKMLLLSANAIATLSIAPIRLIQFFGLFLCLVALVSFPIAMVLDLYMDVDIIIYVVCLQILLSGGLMGTIGILGGYLHRIQDEVRSRPLYVVDSIWRNGRINE